MNSLEILLTVFVTLLLALNVLQMWWNEKSKRTMNSSYSSLQGHLVHEMAEQETSRHLAMLHLLDKQSALLSTTDPLVFQSIQVMNSSDESVIEYDPGDEAELERLNGRGDGLSEYEQSFLEDVGIVVDTDAVGYPVS